MLLLSQNCKSQKNYSKFVNKSLAEWFHTSYNPVPLINHFFFFLGILMWIFLNCIFIHQQSGKLKGKLCVYWCILEVDKLLSTPKVDNFFTYSTIVELYMLNNAMTDYDQLCAFWSEWYFWPRYFTIHSLQFLWIIKISTQATSYLGLEEMTMI